MLGAYLLKDKKVSDIRRVKVTGYAWYETDLAIKNYRYWSEIFHYQFLCEA